MPKNPLDAILSEVLGDDGGLLMAAPWPDDPDEDEPLGGVEFQSNRRPPADEAETPAEEFLVR